MAKAHGVEGHFPIINCMSEDALQEIALLLLTEDDMVQLWQKIGEDRRVLFTKSRPEDLQTMLKLFEHEEDILELLRRHYVTGAHTKGNKGLHEAKQSFSTMFSNNPAEYLPNIKTTNETQISIKLQNSMTNLPMLQR